MSNVILCLPPFLPFSLSPIFVFENCGVFAYQTFSETAMLLAEYPVMVP